MDSFRESLDLEYLDDPEDYWQSPEETARLGTGDCEDKALYLRALLIREGIDAAVVFGVQDITTSRQMHAWVEIMIDGKRFLLDPTDGFIARRDRLAPWSHVPILNMPVVSRKLMEYTRRTGDRGINAHYEDLVERQRLAEQDQKQASEQAKKGRPTGQPF